MSAEPPVKRTIVFLRDVKASEEFLLPLFEECGISTSKKDLFLIAAEMRDDEIHPEVRQALEVIAELVVEPAPSELPLGEATPAIEGQAENEGARE